MTTSASYRPSRPRATAPHLFFYGTQGKQLDLLFAQLDLERIAGLQTQLGGANLSRD